MIENTYKSESNTLQLVGFKANKIEGKANLYSQYFRRDFYKISLISGRILFDYTHRNIDANGTFLFFGNPNIPYKSNITSETLNGYACIFTEEFLKLNDLPGSNADSILFRLASHSIIQINEEQSQFLSIIFSKIVEEQSVEYNNKDALIRSYLQLIIQEGLKNLPEISSLSTQKGSSRITQLFLELLEQQFPIESRNTPLSVRTPNDFSKKLNVHTNYLNRTIKEITGKSTSAHISERINTEAKALLEHTDWPITDIAFALGFEYTTYFNSFFKKMSGKTPKAMRNQLNI